MVERERMGGDREKDVVIGSRHQDPDEVGFTQWRCGLYIAGDLNNFLMSTSAKQVHKISSPLCLCRCVLVLIYWASPHMLLDDFFCYKAKALAQAQPFEVHLHPHINVSESLSPMPHWTRIHRQCAKRLV